MNDIAKMDVEAIVRDEPEGKKLQLRVWLRLLSCANLISAEIRKRLREEFDVTLPRFDLLSQLYREPNGLRLGELSRRLMVTNGNLTGLSTAWSRKDWSFARPWRRIAAPFSCACPSAASAVSPRWRSPMNPGSASFSPAPTGAPRRVPQTGLPLQPRDHPLSPRLHR